MRFLKRPKRADAPDLERSICRIVDVIPSLPAPAASSLHLVPPVEIPDPRRLRRGVATALLALEVRAEYAPRIWGTGR